MGEVEVQPSTKSGDDDREEYPFMYLFLISLFQLLVLVSVS